MADDLLDPPPVLRLARTYGVGETFEFSYNIPPDMDFNGERDMNIYIQRNTDLITYQCIGYYNINTQKIVLNGQISLDHMLKGSTDRDGNKSNAIYMMKHQQGTYTEHCIRPHKMLEEGTIIYSPTRTQVVVVDETGYTRKTEPIDLN